MRRKLKLLRSLIPLSPMERSRDTPAGAVASPDTISFTRICV